MNKYTELIESKSIREYLNEIDFVPSAFEMAYIVESSPRLTLKEKHKLWNEIIETTPDERLKTEGKSLYMTLHEYLKNYMDLQNKLCMRFLENEKNTVYTCSSGVVIDTENNKALINNPFYYCNIYADLKFCIEDARKKKYPLFDVRKHYIKTKSDDTDYKCLWADMSPCGEFMNVGGVFVMDDDEDEMYQFFKNATVSIPLPFKQGDLIRSKSCDFELMEFKSYKNGYVCVSEIDKSDTFRLNSFLDIEYFGK